MDWCAIVHGTAEGDDLSWTGNLDFLRRLLLSRKEAFQRGQRWSTGVTENSK